MNYIEEVKKEFDKRNKERAISHTVGWPVYTSDEILAALESLLDLKLSQGNEVKSFEKEYLNYIGLSESDGHGAIACNSGSSANLLVFASLIESGKLKKGDEVVVPAATFATVSSILYQLGLVPVYVDSELDTWNMCPKSLLSSITSNTKAVMLVHNLGFPAKLDEIMEICSDNDLILVEDCCEAHGAMYKGKQVGSFGDMSAISFFVAHNITTGEGGMVFYKDKKLDVILRQKREFGRMIGSTTRYVDDLNLGNYDSRYIFESLGYNLRMTDVLASIGRIQLKKLKSLNNQRNDNAKRLSEIVNKHSSSIGTLIPLDDCESGYYGFPIFVKKDSGIDRNELCQFLEKNNIETRPNMGGCLPDQPGFVNENHKVHGDLHVARFIRDNAFFIGVHSALDDQHFENFDKALDEFFNK